MSLWNIGRIVSNGKYARAYVPEHPAAAKCRGFVHLHRVIMENKLGRILEHDEVVHHIDGNGKNNNEENLQLMTRSEHQSLHVAADRRKGGDPIYGTPVFYVCDGCGIQFSRKFRRRDALCKHFCSRQCVCEYAAQFAGRKPKSPLSGSAGSTPAQGFPE